MVCMDLTNNYHLVQDQMGGKNVLFVAPFVHKDLSQRSIADTIFDLKVGLNIGEYSSYLGGGKHWGV